MGPDLHIHRRLTELLRPCFEDKQTSPAPAPSPTPVLAPTPAHIPVPTPAPAPVSALAGSALQANSN